VLSRYDEEEEEEEEEEEARAKTNIEYKEPPQDSNTENNMSSISEEPHSMNEEDHQPVLQMKKLYINQDKATNIIHIIYQTTYLLIYLLV